MNAILQVSLAFFRFLPLQRVLNGIAGGLLALALVLLALSRPELAVLAGILVVVTLVLTPVMAGGFALRYYLSQPTVALRPHGRVRVMLGATLAISLIAALAALPILALVLTGEVARRASPVLTPLTAFAIVWNVTSLLWIVVFIITNTRVGWWVVLLLPFPLGKVGARFTASLPQAPWLLATGLVLWAAFVLWYLRPHRIRRPVWLDRPPPADAGDRAAVAVTPQQESCTRTDAERQYLLGAESLRRYAYIGLAAFAFVALMMLWMMWITAGRPNQHTDRWPAFVLIFLSLFGMSTSYNIVRRARLLWLRAGLDRNHLFALCERSGLTASALAIGSGMVLLTLWLAIRTPASLPGLLVSVFAVMVLAASLYYLGLALTRGWNVADILLGTVVLVLMVGHIVYLRPLHADIPEKVPALMALTALSVGVLRIHARRRWRGLDWKVAGLPQLRSRIA